MKDAPDALTADDPLDVADWMRLGRRARAVIGQEEPLRLTFPGGRLFVDHAGLALAVHRCDRPADGTRSEPVAAACGEAHRLVTSQPSYLLASTDDDAHVRGLAHDAVEALAACTDRVLVVEVWSPLPEPDDAIDPFGRRPGFTLYVPDDDDASAAADALCDALSGIEIADQAAEVSRVAAPSVAPPGLDPLVPDGDDVATLGLAVDAVFVNARDGEFYPGVLEDLRAALSPALARAAGAFARSAGARTRRVPAGRRHLEPIAETVDRGLSEVSRQYGFLLQVTPVNSADAWAEFKASGAETAPDLLYRPLTFEPDPLRRALFALPVEEVEDPVVAELLREKRDEMAVQIQMMLDRETPQFLGGSVRLYGAPDEDLVELARDLLAALPSDGRRSGQAVVGSTAFAARARAELDHYATQWDGFDATVEVRHDIPGSLMVSSGQLLVGGEASVPEDRVDALLAHEVGTHVVTYYNGAVQPLRILRHGLAGYEGLQEGIAVLSEWLVGGLTAGRMRTLGARVLAARALVDGSDLVETVRLLRDEAGLSLRGAFGVAVRVHRGGGLTKDMIYLRGLRDLLVHLGRGGPFWDLFIGKLALCHVEPLQSLRARGVLAEPPLTPRFATRDDACARLEQTRAGLTVLDLLSD